jgi:hypothetical protein
VVVMVMRQQCWQLAATDFYLKKRMRYFYFSLAVFCRTFHSISMAKVRFAVNALQPTPQLLRNSAREPRPRAAVALRLRARVWL